MSPAIIHRLLTPTPQTPRYRLACTDAPVNPMQDDVLEGSLYAQPSTGHHYAFSPSLATCPACRAKKEGAK